MWVVHSLIHKHFLHIYLLNYLKLNTLSRIIIVIMDNLNIFTKNYNNRIDKQKILRGHGLRQLTWQYLYLYNTYNTYTIITIPTILIQY